MYLVLTTLGLTQRILQRLENVMRLSGEKVASTKVMAQNSRNDKNAGIDCKGDF